jgi:hypothetical protein
MSGDLTEVEICDLCGNETEEYSIIEGLVVCKSCKEDLELNVTEDNSSDVCAICGWPINRPISIRESKKFTEGIIKWLDENGFLNEGLNSKISKFSGKKLYMCRYDFFYLIKDIISSENEEAAKEFEEKIASKYEFGGGIVS